MHSIAITLGHNSSAILIGPNGKILGGYETERLNGIKSSSEFPSLPIDRLLFDYGLDYDEVDAYVGHWFTSGNLPEQSTKHCNLEVLSKFHSVNSLSQDLTHHDSHLESALVFAGSTFCRDDTIAMVMDGFGTMGECMSIYQVTSSGYKLLQRVFGYQYSLGLLYQYATDFMGMKMNNHEYKILAYEVLIDEIVANKKSLIEDAQQYSSQILKGIYNSVIYRDMDPVVNVSALLDTQAYIQAFLADSLNIAGVDVKNLHDKRIATAYIVQLIVEITVLELRKLFPSKNLLLAGGLFYNVKLNSLLCDTCDAFCVMPLSGDQGAGLGVYNAFRGDLVWPEHVFWGYRNLYEVHDGDGILVIDTIDEAMPVIESEIKRIGFVNLVRGSMEFGPRALCNTTTLALPYIEITSIVNEINNRTSEMPMAPVMTESQIANYFIDTDKVHKSLEYMIVTRKYRLNDIAAAMSGAAHYYPDGDFFTGRPQLTRDPAMIRLLEKFGPLVNTSFNFHGLPIVFDKESIEHTHKAQRAIRPDLNITTIVIRN